MDESGHLAPVKRMRKEVGEEERNTGGCVDRTQGEATTPLLRWEGTSSSINRFSGGTYRIHEEEIHRIFEAVNTVITLGGEEEEEEEEEEEGLFKANAGGGGGGGRFIKQTIRKDNGA